MQLQTTSIYSLKNFLQNIYNQCYFYERSSLMNSSLTVASELQNLLMTPKLLAKLTAVHNLKDYKTKFFDYFDYPIGFCLQLLEKKNISSASEAFSILFLSELYFQNDWLEDESDRTNEDQFVIEKLEPAEWENALAQYCIPQYFNLGNRTPNVQLWDISKFQNSFLYWMPQSAADPEVQEIKKLLSETLWVCNLFPGSFYEPFFGELKEYYFIGESGVYD